MIESVVPYFQVRKGLPFLPNTLTDGYTFVTLVNEPYGDLSQGARPLRA